VLLAAPRLINRHNVNERVRARVRVHVCAHVNQACVSEAFASGAASQRHQYSHAHLISMIFGCERHVLANPSHSCVWCVMLLAGHPTGITFSGATVGRNAVHVAAFQAPGVSGSSIWLLPDPAAVAAMPGGQHWQRHMVPVLPAVMRPVATTIKQLSGQLLAPAWQQLWGWCWCLVQCGCGIIAGSGDSSGSGSQ
jgi:hypothetical protein